METFLVGHLTGTASRARSCRAVLIPLKKGFHSEIAIVELSGKA
jgi:hypothetical protein